MVFAPESWTIERMTLGEESGWQVVSAHEPDLGGFGVVSQMAVFCTATYASVDFAFISGGAMLEGGAGYGARHTTLVSSRWLVAPLRPVDQIGMHQFPPWGEWTARIDGGAARRLPRRAEPRDVRRSRSSGRCPETSRR